VDKQQREEKRRRNNGRISKREFLTPFFYIYILSIEVYEKNINISNYLFIN
jgi:ribosomal 30S subunit maturation factor RimM